MVGGGTAKKRDPLSCAGRRPFTGNPNGLYVLEWEVQPADNMVHPYQTSTARCDWILSFISSRVHVNVIRFNVDLDLKSEK